MHATIPRRICDDYSETKISPKKIIKEILLAATGSKSESHIELGDDLKKCLDISDLNECLLNDTSFCSDDFDRYFKTITYIFSYCLYVPIRINNDGASESEKNDMPPEDYYDLLQEDIKDRKKCSHNIKVLMKCFSGLCKKELPGHYGIIQLLSPYNLDNYYKDRKFEYEPIFHEFDKAECYNDDVNTSDCEDNNDEVILKMQTDYYGLPIIKEFLFTFICNIVIRCLHNKQLSAKEISEIYVTVLLSLYYDEYLIIYEKCKNAKTSDPLFNIKDNAYVTEKIAEMIQIIDETIAEYPCYIYETSEIVREMKIITDVLRQQNEELAKYTAVLPHITADARSHKDIRTYNDILQLFYKI